VQIFCEWIYYLETIIFKHSATIVYNDTDICQTKTRSQTTSQNFLIPKFFGIRKFCQEFVTWVTSMKVLTVDKCHVGYKYEGIDCG